MNYKVVVSYDGTAFEGYQVQKEKRTVQKEIEDALFKLYTHEVKIHSAGRTDKGVHALGQVFNYYEEKEIDLYKIKKAMNTFLPKDIAVVSVETVPDDFHARGSARSKEYLYKLNMGTFNPLERNYVYQHGYKLDVKKLKEASKVFLGTHDYKNFCTTEEDEKKTFVRTISKIEIKQDGDILTFRFIGTGFLRYMVRMIIGSLIAYAQGKVEIDHLKFSLSEECKHRTMYKVPSEGLYLVKVNYK